MRIRYFPVRRIDVLTVFTMTLPLAEIGDFHAPIVVLLSGLARDAGEKEGIALMVAGARSP